MTAALRVQDLDVTAPGGVRLLRGVSLTVRPGVPLTILGETGSGKTLVMEAVMGTLDPGLAASGRIGLGGDDTAAGDRAARRPLWGRGIALLPQEPWLALDPTMRALGQVAETHRFVRHRAGPAARAAAASDLAALGLGDALRRYPHELSGGMAQRVAIAAARAGGAPVLLADEPTKGLDAGRRDTVVRLLHDALGTGGILLTITHDVAVARLLGGEVAVMSGGEVIEQGPAARVLSAPTHAYTCRLLAADPAAWPDTPHPAPGAVVLSADDLAVDVGGHCLFSGVDLRLGAGEWAAATGPSGCGKTTLGNVLLGLRRPGAGRVTRGAGIAATRFQKLYQDPIATFAPRLPLRVALDEAAALHRVPPQDVAALLARLRIPDALLDRVPHQVSGGELQRIALARALLPAPVFIFADEPTSRLDLITQQDTMAVLRDVSAERGCAVLLVTHDAAIAAKLAGQHVALGPEQARAAA